MQLVGNEFDFTLENSRMTDSLQIMMDKGIAGANFEIYGMSCKDPLVEAEKEKKKLMDKLGIPVKIVKLTADCNTDMSDLKMDNIVIVCTEVCQPNLPSGKPSFERIVDS